MASRGLKWNGFGRENTTPRPENEANLKRIGITFSHHDWPTEEDNKWRIQAYIDALEDAGARAEPLWLPRDEQIEPRADELARDFDGLMISGGADLPPSLYNEETLPDAHVSLVPAARPAFEAALLTRFLERDKPALGICYGCQFFNVWRGGSLIQDIPTQWNEPIEHSSERGNIPHMVRVLEHTKLRAIVEDEEFEIVSSHHQAIARLAQGAQTSAFAPDRLAESIEFEGAGFFLGVQWHPERSRESSASQRLFHAFVNNRQL